jgi:FkbM family methyltransferase
MAATYMGDGRVLLQTIYGHLMLVNGSDTGIVPHLIRDGWFDRNITDIIFRLLEPGMTFIDIGANCGTYAVLGAAKVERSGRAIAIEASPRLAHLLQETIDLNGLTGHCDVLSCAAGAEPGKLVLHQMANRQGGSTLLKDIAERAASGLMGESLIATEVEVRTLDDIIAERDITRIDLIKIDVEGFEYEVLQGARATLHRFRPRMILEWHNAFFEGRQEVARALYDYLTVELGYQLHRIEQGATTRPVTLDDLRHGHADVIAEPPS